MIDNVLDCLVRIHRRCNRAIRKFDGEPMCSTTTRLRDAINEIDESWGKCFIGRIHSCVYIEGFAPRMPGEFYSNIDSRGNRWVEYSAKAVQDELFRRAGLPDESPVDDAAKAVEQVFAQSKNEALPCFDALLSDREDTVLSDLRDELKKLKSHLSQSNFASVIFPHGTYATTWNDQAAGEINPVLPPHLACQAWLLSKVSYRRQLETLSEIAKHGIDYLRLKLEMKGNTVAKNTGKVFIGHGRSSAWRDLKDFLQDRLELEWDEFNRESTAGFSTKERLETMLDDACFAFLVMTGEDEQADGSVHARENVIHEVGLFQGRLGFPRAIVLLEEGCNEFGNITGLTQIRFPKGDILSKSEEIRRVLEREEIIGK